MSKLYIMGFPPLLIEGLSSPMKEKIVFCPGFPGFPTSKIKQITRFLFVGRIPLPLAALYFWFSKQGVDALKAITASDCILFYECSNLRILKALKQFLPAQTHCCIYYSNPIQRIFHSPDRQLKQIKELGFTVYTFDPQDAATFQLQFAGQYLRYPEEPLPQTFTSDCFFCGLPKDRLADLNQLRQTLEESGLQCNFIIPHSKESVISYQEYLRQLSLSRCVIDICQQGQTGITRRPLEALFYNKKLITNNPAIRQYNFYRPENIFIWGEDAVCQLHDFIHTPVLSVPSEIKRRYDINEWLTQFLKKEPDKE